MSQRFSSGLDLLDDKFSSGLDLANFVATTDILYQAWAAVWELYNEICEKEGPYPSPVVKFKSYEQQNCTIIAFFTWPAHSKDYIQGGGGGGDLISSSILNDTFSPFEFLCTEDNPHISINKAALELFYSILDALHFLKYKIDNSKPLIITGNSLGGSVASLFTLWLLETLDFSTTKCPLCITFGSPLIGDDGLQEAISKYPTWNSCFLHVVSDQDPLPRVLISTQNPIVSASQANVYKPFGIFLLCSELGCACFECSQSILGLLKATYSGSPENQNPNNVFEFYGTLMEHINHKVICRDSRELVKSNTESLRASIITQLDATGLVRSQQQQRNMGIDLLISNMESQERKLVFMRRQVFNPSKELNEMKVLIAYLEWYKKWSKDHKIGYYDEYKNPSHTIDTDVRKYVRALTCYWEEIVDETKKMPQKEAAYFRTQWLPAGTTYRRMIEPLEIAKYYKEGHQRDYINQGRSKHYKKLEQWLNETLEKPTSGPNYLKKKNVASNLTNDSCFWAHVEEALISCKLLSSTKASVVEKESSKKNLIGFENYVLSLMRNYAVSPEIFLPQSSFMRWWKEYEKIIGISYTSAFTYLMKNCRYNDYATGCL